VLCDRYLDSTSVYQGVARQIDPVSVDTINQFAIGQTLPDLTILIDLDPTVGMERVKARSGGKLDRMEQEAIEFFEAVRAGYLKAAAADPQRFLVVNGDQSIEAIQAEIWEAVEILLPTAH
jgi:dTMP kinase